MAWWLEIKFAFNSNFADVKAINILGYAPNCFSRNQFGETWWNQTCIRCKVTNNTKGNLPPLDFLHNLPASATISPKAHRSCRGWNQLSARCRAVLRKWAYMGTYKQERSWSTTIFLSNFNYLVIMINVCNMCTWK